MIKQNETVRLEENMRIVQKFEELAKLGGKNEPLRHMVLAPFRFVTSKNPGFKSLTHVNLKN